MHVSLIQDSSDSRITTRASVRPVGSRGLQAILTDVTGREGDDQLLRLGALAAGLGHGILVEQLHRALKAGELHHGVGDLPHPQRNHTLVEADGDTGKSSYI